MGDKPPVALPDRPGTFIIPDIYPPDLGPNPPLEHLKGLKIGDKEVIGCFLKAGEGLGWGSENEMWFRRCWQRLQHISGPDFFPGCYHFLRFSVDGAQQADYFIEQVLASGGFGAWSLAPWLDIEEGGQGHWAPGPLEKCDAPTKLRLAAEVTRCATAFVQRFKQRTGLRIHIYGRGLFRDLGMRDCLFGADAVVNPAYTAHMPPMDAYGATIDRISFWQLCGDGQVFVPGYPITIPGWGKTDYSVYIDGSKTTTLASLRERCLARK